MSGEKKGPVLDNTDRHSATWKKLKQHLQDRIALLRARNDRHHDDRKTAALRGSIDELKYLCSLDADKPAAPPEDALFKD